MNRRVDSIIESFLSEHRIYSVKYNIRPKDTIVLPPLSSNLLKNLMYLWDPLEPIKKLYEGSKRPRAVSFRFLKSSEGKPLFATASAEREAPLHMKKDQIYEGEYVVVSKDASWIGGALSNPYADVETSYGKATFELSEVKAWSAPSYDSASAFLIWISTPLFISSKIALPPVLEAKASRIPNSYILSISPGAIASSIVKQLMEHMGMVGKKDQKIPYFVLRYYDLAVREIDFRIESKVVLLGKDKNGKMRKAKGVVGKLYHRPLSRKVAESYGRLLSIGSAMGIGKSRGIGFGEIKVEKLDTAGSQEQNS